MRFCWKRSRVIQPDTCFGVQDRNVELRWNHLSGTASLLVGRHRITSANSPARSDRRKGITDLLMFKVFLVSISSTPAWAVDSWKITFFGQQVADGPYVQSPSAHCTSINRMIATQDGRTYHSAVFKGFIDSQGQFTSDPSKMSGARCEFMHPNWSIVWRASYRYEKNCPSGLDPMTGECGSPNSQKGPPSSCPSAYAGNPINTAIGNKFQYETDYHERGASSLAFSRSYNSLDQLWRHSFSTHLTISPSGGGVALVQSTGRTYYFTVTGDGAKPVTLGSGVLRRTETGWEYLAPDNERFTFDSEGRLLATSSPHGGHRQLARNGNRIVVTDSAGNSLTITQGEDYQPLTLSARGVKIAYTYNSDNRLVMMSRTADDRVTNKYFHYEDVRNSGLLTGITDERGVRYATWAYDERGRAVSSEHANGADRSTVNYISDRAVSVRNELNSTTQYTFGFFNGAKRVIAIDGEASANCPDSNTTFTYNDLGLLTSKTDNKGNVTTYEYNDRGLEVSRTEAAGTPVARTVTTAWHPTLFLPVKVTEPNQITKYSYDADGRTLSRTVTDR